MVKKKLLTKPPNKSRPAKPSKPAKVVKPAPRSDTAIIRQTIEAGNGILRLAPTWVPRSFLMPGRRLKLAVQDLYAYGAKRGGIDERWFSSTTPAANEGAAWDEGLSHVVYDGNRAFTLREAIAYAGEDLVGP